MSLEHINVVANRGPVKRIIWELFEGRVALSRIGPDEPRAFRYIRGWPTQARFWLEWEPFPLWGLDLVLLPPRRRSHLRVGYRQHQRPPAPKARHGPQPRRGET